jgi:transforming growth factor-beta-induced protein
MSKIVAVLASALLTLSLVTAASAGEIVRTQQDTMPEQEATDIVDTAVAAGNFTTLAAALGAADLVDTLKGPGPFTVFAPTDDAFAALPAGTVDALLADVPALTDVLLNHVVSGDVRAADVIGLSSATTVGDDTLYIDIVDGNVIINGSVQVTATDIVASNGVIHVIDAVILPLDDIVDTAVAAGAFDTLAVALDAAGLIDTLKGPGPFTVFAPTDDAFAALPAGTVEALLGDIPALSDILLYHVVSGAAVRSGDVVQLSSATTVAGEDISIEVVDGGVVLNDSVMVTAVDVYASNGVIHVIDGVLLPPADDAPGAADTGNAGIAADSGTSMSLLALMALAATLGIAGVARMAVGRNRTR